MLYASHATGENYKLSLPAPPPPSPLNRQVPKYVSLLQDTGLFHFFLDKILISLAVWFFLVRFHSSSNCIKMVQQSIIVILFFPCPALTDLCVSSSASNKETIGMAEKTHQTPPIKWQKMKPYNNACMTDFPWHRREDDVDTVKSGVSAWPLFCKPCCAKMQTREVNRNLISKRGRSSTSLGLINVDCSGRLKVCTRFIFLYCWYCIPIVSTV